MRRKRLIGVLAALALAGTLAAGAGRDAARAAPAQAVSTKPTGLVPPPAGLTGREVARRAEETLRGDTAVMKARMIIDSPRLPVPRTVEFRSWDDRLGDRSFVRILAPTKDEGTGFLMRKPNLWMYLPRVERSMRIPPSMMLQSWMGSDFTNDDLVRESSQLDDYDQTLLGVDPHPEGHPGRRAYVVEYRPHEDAPVVWGKIVAWIDTERWTPLRQEYYDEDGHKLRVFRLSQIRKVQRRWFPYRWEMTPLDKPGHRTTIEIESVRFNEPIPARVFTTRNLREWR